MNVIKKLLLIASIPLTALLTACGPKQTPVQSGIEQQVLHKGNAAEPSTLDPHTTSGLPEWKIISGLFESLISLNSKTLQPEPAVAKTWSISRDGKTYTFNLRSDAKWSNGDPVTAHDFVFSYQRALSRNLGCPYAYTFYDVKNAEAFHKQELTDFNQVGIHALDDLTLRIELNHPVPYLLSMMNTLAWFPVHKDTILEHGKIDERGTNWIRAGNLISNGPFKLKSWNISRSVILEQNPHYWDHKSLSIKEMHFHPIQNLNTEERAFRTQQLHITESLPHQKVKHYREINAPELRINPYFANYAYIFNTNKEPFNDPRVRKALTIALDRQSIIDNVTQKGELPAFSYTPPGLPGYKIKDRIHENVEEARRLLAEAGFPNGEGFPTIKMLYNTSESHKSIAEAMQHMWRKSLNINTELINQEWKVYLKARHDSDFHLIRFGWVGDYMDVNVFLSLFKSESGNNFSGWSNPRFDSLVEQANLSMKPKKRFQLMQQAEDILMNELPVMPIYYYNTAYLVHPSVKNWESNVMDKQTYKNLYLEN